MLCDSLVVRNYKVGHRPQALEAKPHRLQATQSTQSPDHTDSKAIPDQRPRTTQASGHTSPTKWTGHTGLSGPHRSQATQVIPNYVEYLLPFVQASRLVGNVAIRLPFLGGWTVD